MVFHANRGKPDLEPAILGEFVRFGWLGVPVFFVISGYCIAERTAREGRAGGGGGRFLLDRLLRIYPPYWAALLLLVILNVSAAWWKGTSLNAPFVLPAGPGGWLRAVLCVEPWFGFATFHLVAWTLAYEVGFYFCAAGGLVAHRLIPRPWLMPLWWGLLLVGGLVPASAAWFPLLKLWPQFALGGMVWLAWQGDRSVGSRLTIGTIAVAVVALAVGWQTGEIGRPLSSWQPADVGLSLVAACACAWLLLVLRCWDGPLAAAPGLRWLGWIGTFSYSLYLVHAPVVSKLARGLEHLPVAGAHRDAVIVLACVGTLPCAWLFYRAVELRSESFRRVAVARIDPPKP
jgi:exopolysaccharide production protein ExoZ